MVKNVICFLTSASLNLLFFSFKLAAGRAIFQTFSAYNSGHTWKNNNFGKNQTCTNPRQRWGNNLGRGGGSPPAYQLAELFWDSWHRGELRRTKVYQFSNGRPIQKPEKPEREPKKYRNTNNFFKIGISIFGTGDDIWADISDSL